MEAPRLTLPMKIGVALGLVHLLLVAVVALDLAREELDAQWQLIWIPFLVADFPVSLLIPLMWYLFPTAHLSFGSYPVSEAQGFIFPVVVHGIIGSLWWFLIPILAARLWARIRGSRSVRKPSPDA